jgi:phospholipid N-methyltransferase
MSVRTRLLTSLNGALRPLHFELVRHNWDDPQQFIPFNQTLAGARAADMTVGDFIDVTYNEAGATQTAVDCMAQLGAFDGKIDVVCEIGPGSGRYLEKVLTRCSPTRVEIYETASPWAEYLRDSYGVVCRATDGSTLSETETQSIDLAMAHKVFVATTSMVTFGYLSEIARVLRAGGVAIFDVFTERCLDPEQLDRWLETDVRSGPYPAAVPRQCVIAHLERFDLELSGTFTTPMSPGMTECFVFSRPGLPVTAE